ncbi:TPA: hypothetical protein N2Q63_005390 [Citrobacter freundii]|nr:hypothetical protein [Citrobacter freundii]HCL6761333.1 hypothetical protein [Citrobacter freundii]HED2425190.1 hypothetical protein [Citrobacter freundii]HED3099678.1 hypothetical protein [Citrobacter freundii]HED3129869.1 hypothetical protein [Citrobacter freundii]
MAIQGALTAFFIVLLFSLWDGVLGPVIGYVAVVCDVLHEIKDGCHGKE